MAWLKYQMEIGRQRSVNSSLKSKPQVLPITSRRDCLVLIFIQSEKYCKISIITIYEFPSISNSMAMHNGRTDERL